MITIEKLKVATSRLSIIHEVDNDFQVKVDAEEFNIILHTLR